jgi:tetratricopeptide (TPR) repeat protein
MNTVEATNDSSPSAEDIYQTLLRSLRRRKSFGIVFVQCSPAQAVRLIPQLQAELPQKNISTLQLTESIDSLYNLVADRPDQKELDILFIQGLEKSLVSDIRAGYGGEGDYYNLSTVPPVLNHLNQQRENFRDRFSNICFVFILPLFAIKYFIRRAPDFFDWGSGVFEFPVGTELEHYLESKLGVSNSIQTQIERERKLAREYCDIDADNSAECAAAWDAVEELQAEASHQRTKADNGHKSFLQQYLDDSPDALEIRLYEDGLYEDENNTQILLEGDHLLKSERYNEAIDNYNKAIKLKPDCLEAWYNRGVAMVKLGHYEEAIDSLQHTLEFKPDYYEAWYNRGVALFDLNHYQEAIDSYSRALEIKPDYYEAWNNQGIALVELGRYQDAINSLEHTLKLKPDYHEAWNNRGIALVELGRYQDAVDSYNKALKIKSNQHEAWYNRGIALVKLGRYEEAVDSYERAVEFKPDKHEAWYNRGIALVKLGRYEEAVDSYERAIKIKTDFLEAWYNRGAALRNLGRYEKAIASYDMAIKIASDESNSHYGKACCYGLQGNVKDAVEALHQAIILNPECQETAKTEADFDRIRNENQFQALVEE